MKQFSLTEEDHGFLGFALHSLIEGNLYFKLDGYDWEKLSPSNISDINGVSSHLTVAQFRIDYED